MYVYMYIDKEKNIVGTYKYIRQCCVSVFWSRISFFYSRRICTGNDVIAQNMTFGVWIRIDDISLNFAEFVLYFAVFALANERDAIRRVFGIRRGTVY